MLSLVSAFLFSLQHNYNKTYMVYAFIVGVYFAILFRNRTKGFTLVMCTHMFLNLIAGLSSL
ncbi:CPBP family glutamic-type intramembrane protease [Dysgonomonas capnocytophagoides]|uniref:CPBP family glutamic-type intramembrane protease n=1 Tax=Dysgonomonas capnocytophagoides TaxID=45254 RepID=UPI0038B265EF